MDIGRDNYIGRGESFRNRIVCGKVKGVKNV